MDHHIELSYSILPLPSIDLRRNFEGDLLRDLQRDLPRDLPRGFEGDLPRDLLRDFEGDLSRDFERDLPRDFEGDLPRDFEADLPIGVVEVDLPTGLVVDIVEEDDDLAVTNTLEGVGDFFDMYCTDGIKKMRF